jgi:tetratricopeptide (TPR) repeat protein
MAKTCAACGLSCPDERLFRTERKSFSSTLLSYCPVCWVKRRHAYGGWSLLLCILMLPAGWLVPQSDLVLRSLGWFLSNSMFMVVWQLPLMLLHELAHACCAWLLGMRVFGISLGVGRKLYEWKGRKFTLELRALPLMGITFPSASSAVGFRWKYFFMVLAGPLVHVLLLVVGLLLIRPWESLGKELQQFTPERTFLYANLLMLIASLWPRKHPHVLAGMVLPMRSDGLNLLTIPFQSQAEIEQRAAAYFAMEAASALERAEYDKARQRAEEGLQHYPTNLVNRLQLGASLLYLQEYAAARKHLLPLLQQEHESSIRAIILNNLAWTDLMLGGEELLQEADRYSEEVLQLLPWVPSLRGTRGSILVELGDFEGGIRLLHEALAGNEDPRNRASNCCYLALAEFRRGNGQKGRAYEAMARKLDPNCLLLNKVRAEIPPRGIHAESDT